MTDERIAQDDDHDQNKVFPARDGIRTDNAGSGASGSVTGPAPSGGSIDSNDRAAKTQPDPGATAGGGTGEGQSTAGEDPQTNWLRQEGESA